MRTTMTDSQGREYIPIESALGHRDLIAQKKFWHPGDWYLTMVLCRVGEKPAEGQPDNREWVTWYYNAQSGGFNEGNYFDPAHDPDAERSAWLDFYRRCTRYCLPPAAPKPEAPKEPKLTVGGWPKTGEIRLTLEFGSEALRHPFQTRNVLIDLAAEIDDTFVAINCSASGKIFDADQVECGSWEYIPEKK